MIPIHFSTLMTNFRITMGATRNYRVTQVRILHKENLLLHREIIMSIMYYSALQIRIRQLSLAAFTPRFQRKKKCLEMGICLSR